MSRKRMYNLIISVTVNRCLVALRNMMSSIGTIHGCDSFGMSFSSMRHNAAALLPVISVWCILRRFVSTAACTRYVFVLLICSCKVGGWSFACYSISNVRMSVIFVSVFFSSRYFLSPFVFCVER